MDRSMKFVNPEIESSYQESAMGKVLYDAIIENGAKKIIDFGVLNGYSTVCMAMAAKQTGGKVFAYDLFDDYKFNGPNTHQLQQNFLKYKVDDTIELKKVDFYKWINDIEDFDVLHLDISNDGDIINKLIKATKHREGLVFFEGGSEERDKQDWMLKYNKKPITEFSNYYDLLKNSTYKTNNRTYYPCISKLK